MPGEIDLSAVNGLTKKVYDKSGLKQALPGSAIIQKRIGYEKGSRKVGESYNVPVVLRPPNGFTYAGSDGSVRTLKNPRNMVTKQATIIPFELDLREQVAFAALTRAAEEGEGSFAQLAGEVLKWMKFSTANRFEAGIIHGQRGLGVVEAVTDLGGGLADLTITAATWAPGLWWAMGEKSTYDTFTGTTKNNASGPIVLEGIKAAERKITVSYTGTLAAEVAANDVIYFEGAYDGVTYLEMPGFMAQSANTTGTSLGLSAATFSNWKGNTLNVAGPISFDVMEEALGIVRDRGASGKITAYLSNKRYGALVAELKSLRVIDSSYSPGKGKTGYSAIGYESREFGEVEIVNHPFFKHGEFLLLEEDECGRVGSADMEFGVGGTPTWERVANTNAVETVLMHDQCVIAKMPSHCLVGTGITD